MEPGLSVQMGAHSTRLSGSTSQRCPPEEHAPARAPLGDRTELLVRKALDRPDLERLVELKSSRHRSLHFRLYPVDPHGRCTGRLHLSTRSRIPTSRSIIARAGHSWTG